MAPYFERYGGSMFVLSEHTEDNSWIKTWLLDEEKTGVGRLYIFLNALLCMMLVCFPYAFLVEFTMLLMAIMMFPFIYSFLILRWREPDTPREFKVPGGWPGAIIMCLPPVVCTVFQMYLVVTSTKKVFGIEHLNVKGVLIIIGVGLLCQLIYTYVFPSVCGCGGPIKDEGEGEMESPRAALIPEGSPRAEDAPQIQIDASPIQAAKDDAYDYDQYEAGAANG